MEVTKMQPNYHSAQYFDVGGLSLEDERVPCTTVSEFAGLGYMDPSSHSDDLESRSKVNWIVAVCDFQYHSSLVLIDLPYLLFSTIGGSIITIIIYHQVELPLWLASLLQKRNYVTIDMPKMFNKRSREQLDAGAASVNLREKSPHYFTVGIELARYKVEREREKKRELSCRQRLII
jgi:hypothetical protein